MNEMLRGIGCAWLVVLAVAATVGASETSQVVRVHAGAAIVDVTPTHLPAIINGGFLRRTAETVRDPLHARAIVIGGERLERRIAIVVVDSCMLPRELLDEAKELAAERTGIASERILISATHTHTAPAAMGALGCEVDAEYAPLLPARIAEAIEQASERLAPAEIGVAVVRAKGHTANRRWINRPGVVHVDPFGASTVRANMHPGSQPPDAAGPSGPVDDDLAILAIRSADDDKRPIALLSSYAMHYFGSGVAPVSADYFGRFAGHLERALGSDGGDGEQPFVALMANGTSGDLWWKDYSRPDYARDVDEYAGTLAELTQHVYRSMTFDHELPLAMAETTLELGRRTPDDERLAWARKVVEEMEGRPPGNQQEVYATEQIYLHEKPRAELKLQAVRIGDFAITAIPNEVYALTGIKLKHHSPLERVMNISLANGSEGYIPPPEQHALGGYNTWPARTAALEVDAEPKIVDAVLGLLEEVSGQPRREFVERETLYARHVLEAEPLAYYRLGELEGPRAWDATGHHEDGAYEPLVVFGLPGVDAAGLANGDGLLDVNRAPHFAGGRVRADLNELGERYSVELWLWTRVAHDLYPVSGYLFSRGLDGSAEAEGDHLGIGGNHGDLNGRLFFFNGDGAEEIVAGETVVEPETWHHAVLVRDGERVTLYLDGKREAAGEAAVTRAPDVGQIFVGGRNDGFAPFAGRIDEVAVYARLLSDEEVAARYEAAIRANVER